MIHQRSYPYTLEQNGVVEHKNKHVVETALVLVELQMFQKYFGLKQSKHLFIS